MRVGVVFFPLPTLNTTPYAQWAKVISIENPSDSSPCGQGTHQALLSSKGLWSNISIDPSLTACPRKKKKPSSYSENGTKMSLGTSLRDQIRCRLNKQNPSKPTLPQTTTLEENYCKNSTNAWLEKTCTGEKKNWIQWLSSSNLNTRYLPPI